MAKKSANVQKEQLFEDAFVPGKAGSGKLFDVEYKPKTTQSVECLGMTFPSDEARLTYFKALLREKLKDPKFRETEGFPIADDEDILALSDPPYYTACPNPFLLDFIERFGKPYIRSPNTYNKEPYAADVSEGKNDPIYLAHSYHTKVPHKAIMRYVMHYTEPGDVVLDGFSGTGMTGVAADRCGDKASIEELGYVVNNEGEVLDEDGNKFSKVGRRYAILNDLAPIASFISQTYNTPFDVKTFKANASQILNDVQLECGWLYRTLHNANDERIEHEISALKASRDGKSADVGPGWGDVNYVIWSDLLVCNNCQKDLVYWSEAVDADSNTVSEDFQCPSCGVSVSKKSLDRKLETVIDLDLRQSISRPRQVPVLINYTFAGQRHQKKPDAFDLAVVDHLEEKPTPYWIPVVPMCSKGTDWGDLCRGYHEGTTNVHQFYTKRNRWILGALFAKIESHSGQLRRMLTAWFTSCQSRLTRLNRYMPNHGRHVGPLSGTYYLSSLPTEISPFYFCNHKLDEFASITLPATRHAIVGTCSTEELGGLKNCIDYIFTDPPFGDNLPYSELNFIWESWLRIRTNNKREAIVSPYQGKSTREYQELMEKAFRVYFDALKPGRWITVEFHNSRNSIWNAIQEALGNVGFVVGDVRTLDKKKGTTKQLYYTSGAVKQDLVISAYRPEAEFEEKILVTKGTEHGVWDFVQAHLKRLPIFVSRSGRAQILAERQAYLLFDRMIAFHVQRGYSVTLSASEFYAGLKQRYPERDGMSFLPEQVVEYDRQRSSITEIEQLQLFVSDEKSAIQWVRSKLTEEPMSYQELSPLYMKEAQKVWEKHEQPLELKTILEQNFVQADNGAWRVPDPKKESDLEQLRHRSLMKEFQIYNDSRGKLKIVRTEALRAGFKNCWNIKDYSTIVQLAKRIPDAVIQEDPALLMYVDNASLLLGE